MTINSVSKMWSRQSGQSEVDRNTRVVKIAFSEGWQVSHSADASETEIINASGLPQANSRYENTFAFCNKVGPSSKIGPCLSIVPIEYAGETGPGGPSDSPLNKKPSINWRSRRSTEQVDKDWWGRPITTTNGESIQGVALELVDQTLNVERNFAFFSPHLLHAYLHSVSSDVFQNYAAGLAKLQDYTADEEYTSDGFKYWKVGAIIDFRYPYQTIPARAWHFRSRHEGLYERIGSLLTFTGGGGSEAGGHAVVNSSGVITAVVVTNGGKDYTAAPTVAAADGTGATFTASIFEGRVVSVAVTAGGTGYRTRIVRAVDDNKEPTQTPVLLKLDGSRELNPNNALWLETQLYGALPYSALGLV